MEPEIPIVDKKIAESYNEYDCTQKKQHIRGA